MEPFFDRLLRSDELLSAVLILFLTPAFRMLWLLGTAVYNHVREFVWSKAERCEVEIGPFSIPDDRLGTLPEVAEIKCLTIRYGTDDYLERMASDQERFEGRTRLIVDTFRFPLDAETRTYRGTVSLRVHRRLGTQFKLFIEGKDDRQAESIRMLLSSLDGVEEVTRSDYGPRPKVWFLLRKFHIVSTYTGDAALRDEERIRNNFYFPV